MLPRERLENKLRELGFSYHGENKTTRTWRKGTQRAYVKKSATVREEFVHQTLRQCGCKDEEIKKFISDAKV